MFAGGANYRRWGRAGPSLWRQAKPAPGPEGDTFIPTGPSPTRPVRFQSHATSARPRQRVSNLTGGLPGLARDILRIFSLLLRAGSPRCFEAATTCSLARAPRLHWGVARSLQSAYEAESVMPLYRPSDSVGEGGLRSAFTMHISSHDKMSRIVIFVFREKLEKKMS